MAEHGLDVYAEGQILTAEPVQLVLLMYEGALRFIRLARAAALDSRVEDAHNAILRTYAIISELMATLDNEKGGDIAAGLERSYDFILRRLKEADIKKDERLLREVEELLVPLAETWRKAFFSKKDEAGDNGGENSAPDTYEPSRVVGFEHAAVAKGKRTNSREENEATPTEGKPDAGKQGTFDVKG